MHDFLASYFFWWHEDINCFHHNNPLEVHISSLFIVHTSDCNQAHVQDDCTSVHQLMFCFMSLSGSPQQTVGTHPLWTETSCRLGSHAHSPASDAGCRKSSGSRRSSHCTRWPQKPPASRNPPRVGRIRPRGRACPPGPPARIQTPGRVAACTRPRSAAWRCPPALFYTRCQTPERPCSCLPLGEHLLAPSEDLQLAAPSRKLRRTAALDCLTRWSPCCLDWWRGYCGLLACMHEI